MAQRRRNEFETSGSSTWFLNHFHLIIYTSNRKFSKIELWLLSYIKSFIYPYFEVSNKRPGHLTYHAFQNWLKQYVYLKFLMIFKHFTQ